MGSEEALKYGWAAQVPHICVKVVNHSQDKVCRGGINLVLFTAVLSAPEAGSDGWMVCRHGKESTTAPWSTKSRINVAHIRGSLCKTPACGINHCSSSTAKGEESSFTSDPKAWTQSALELFNFGPLRSLADWSLGSLGCNLSDQRLVCATDWVCQEPRPECRAHSSGGNRIPSL